MKRIEEYEIVDHGIEHEQYFQGCGTAFSKFDDVYTGIGNSLKDALNDAAEQTASEYEVSSELGYEIDGADNVDYSDHAPDETKHTDCGDTHCFAEGMHYYASIRVRGLK